MHVGDFGYASSVLKGLSNVVEEFGDLLKVTSIIHGSIERQLPNGWQDVNRATRSGLSLQGSPRPLVYVYCTVGTKYCR